MTRSILMTWPTTCLIVLLAGASLAPRPAAAQSPPGAGDVEAGRSAPAPTLPLPSPAEQARIAAALGSPCPGVPFAFSYMITNRNSPWATGRSAIVPAPPGSLSFFTASGAYRSDQPRTHYQSTAQQDFLTRLRAYLNRQPGARKRLGLYIHGLGNLLSDAIVETAAFGCALAQPQGAPGSGYPGLVIGFSWPSYATLDSARFYASNPPTPPSGTIRDNIPATRPGVP